MSDSEKVTALDFVINVLREHEKALDSVARRLEEELKDLSDVKKGVVSKPSVLFLCIKWSDFKKASKGSEVISFSLNDELEVRALKDNILYEYKEAVLKRTDSMECGLKGNMKLRLDAEEVRKWLAKELKVPSDRVMEGEIRFSP